MTGPAPRPRLAPDDKAGPPHPQGREWARPCARCGCSRYAHAHHRGNCEFLIAECAICRCPSFTRPRRRRLARLPRRARTWAQRCQCSHTRGGHLDDDQSSECITCGCPFFTRLRPWTGLADAILPDLDGTRALRELSRTWKAWAIRRGDAETWLAGRLDQPLILLRADSPGQLHAALRADWRARRRGLLSAALAAAETRDREKSP